MIKVKSLGAPTPGAHWSYGPRFMQRIAPKDARGLCGMYPTPAMGCETVCAFTKNVVGGFDRLTVQNISGAYFLACTSISVDQWPEVFRVEIVGAPE